MARNYNTVQQLSLQVAKVAWSDTPLRDGDRKLKFTQVHNFCHHFPLPQRTKTEFKNSFTSATTKFTRGCSHETELRVNRTNFIN